MSDPADEAGTVAFRTTFSTLIEPAVVAAHADDDDWVVVDCRFDLAYPTAGERAYREGHLPGAVYASLDHDLSGTRSGLNGRHPLPDPERLRRTFGEWGIGAGVQVVAYDQQNGMYASRLWWLLRASGHEAVAVMDGGFARWQADGRPVRGGEERRSPRAFDGLLRKTAWVGADDVERMLGSAEHRLIDARAPVRFSGAVEPLDPVAGHIPGAVNHFFELNLTAGGGFLTPEELRGRLTAAMGGVAPEHTIVYCGSGVTACHDLLAMEHAGLRGARLYAGSWSEWCSNPSRPVQRGPA